jgi:cytochrome b561
MENRHSVSDEAAPSWKYAVPTIWLHWIAALLIIGLLCIGRYMMSIEDKPGSDWYFDQHKSFGLDSLENSGVLSMSKLLC